MAITAEELEEREAVKTQQGGNVDWGHGVGGKGWVSIWMLELSLEQNSEGEGCPTTEHMQNPSKSSLKGMQCDESTECREEWEGRPDNQAVPSQNVLEAV